MAGEDVSTAAYSWLLGGRGGGSCIELYMCSTELSGGVVW